MVFASYPNSDRKLSIIISYNDLARTKQIELQTPTQAGLVDIRQQSSHFGFAGQLFFQLNNILLNLLALLL